MMRPFGHPLHMVDRVAATQRTRDRFFGKGYALGVCDCIRIAAAHLRQFGYKPKTPKAAPYRSVTEAKAKLLAAGYESVEDALDALGLTRVAPAAAIVGDIIQTPSEDELAALNIYLGNGRVLGFHEHAVGACIVQPRAFVAAWRVVPK